MDVQTFIDSTGKKRRGHTVRCAACGNAFVTRHDQVRKYCSAACKYQGQRTREHFQCSNYRQPFERKPSAKNNSKSGFYFCSRCKDQAQRIGGIEAIMPPHYGTGDDNEKYRRLFSESELICARCGYHEFVCGVDIHHLDGDKTNNARENLLPLCAPCHRALHFRLWSLEDILGPSLNRESTCLASRTVGVRVPSAPLDARGKMQG